MKGARVKNYIEVTFGGFWVSGGFGNCRLLMTKSPKILVRLGLHYLKFHFGIQTLRIYLRGQGFCIGMCWDEF